jgi:predicted O-methyltransferase YrrM/tetratricopeptide (TPR) repeat protein
MLDVPQIAALDVGGGNACTPEEYAFLGALVRLIAPRSIVEIGTSTGIGTLVMAAALVDAEPSSAAPRLTTIDLPLGRATFADGLARNRAAVEGLVPAIAGVVEYRLGESHAVLDALIAEGRQADFVFIDGGHSEAVVRGDWVRALALQPRVVVLHDTIHLADVARVAGELSARYPGVTIRYPRRSFPGQPPPPPGAPGPGFTIISDLAHVEAARADAARPLQPSAHEVASALLRDRVVTPAQARRLAPHAIAGTPPLRELEIVLSGRNDDYGGEDFHERMLTVAAFNHDRLVEAGVPHRFTLVEWNPPAGRPTLIDRLRERLPWWHRSWVVSRDWHAWYQENPRLQFMEFFAKNAGIRRATGDWILTTNSDVFLGREIVERLAAGRLVPGTLYRASRFDLDRQMPRDGVSWDRLEDPRHLLRRNDPEPPYWNEAAGDFLLLDRDSCHRLGGFNERVRFTKIHKDSQFCLQAWHHGLALEWLGPVYHIDHDGSFVNTRHTYQPGFADAPFGPDWDSWQPFWNREDWGVRGAIEEHDGATTWLRTPEEAGPVLTLLLHGQGDAAARTSAIDALLSAAGTFELLVVDPDPALDAALAARACDPRLRLIGEPDVARGTAPGAALRIAECCARGRHLVHLPGAVVIDPLMRLLARLESAAEPGPLVHVIEAGAGVGERALTIVSRRAWDRLDGLDALSGDAIGDFAARARRTFGATVIEDVAARAVQGFDASACDPTVDAAWSALGNGEPVPALVAADLTRRGELLTAHLRERLARELPPEAREIAIFGVGPVTPFAMAAVWALGRHVLGVYAAGADSQLACAGLTVQPASELQPRDALWVVATCASPGDVTVLLDRMPVNRVVHAVEPASVRPSAPPFATGPAFAGLAYARASRTGGALSDAEAAYRALLRDPAFVDAVTARYELALVQEQLGKLREAEAGLRWTLRHWPDARATVLYNLGSFYERQGRWTFAERAFARALALTPSDDAARRGGCHFHLGEIALARGDEAAARQHFTRAVADVPNHGKARARLDAVPGAARR